jgi:hypothetical protein
VNPGWLVAIACCYVPLAVFGSRLMRNRNPYRLHGLWTLWNMTMCLFSACGAYYVWVDLLLPNIHIGVCNPNLGIHSRRGSAFILPVFCLTKPIEFIDTIFLVLHKKELSAFHLFHHCATALFALQALLYSWDKDSTGYYMAGMNLAVHGLMYGYFALTHFFPRWKRLGLLVAIPQALQMFAGIYILLVAIFRCHSLNTVSVIFGISMYSIYSYFFLQIVLEKWHLLKK